MAVPAYSHIVVVVMENHNYSEIAGNPDAPFINSLMAGGANLTNFSALMHPSQPNYFALYAGSTFGTTDDNAYSEPDPTLYTVLHNAGLTFTGYVDTTGGGSDLNHDPWVSFPEGYSVQTNFTSFPALFPSGNYSSLPSVSYVIPSITNDMHSGTIAAGDSWLQANLAAYAQWALTNNSLLVVVWDESNDASAQTTNQVPAILYGANVVPGNYNTAYNDYNLLSTITGAFGLTGPNNAATADTIQVFCFMAGTLIRTPDGEAAVETLERGDLVVTADGAAKPIRWVGRQTISAIFADPLRNWPIRVKAGALADNVPSRDLLLSPDHALLVGGVLIQAAALVNGTSIVRESEVSSVFVYYHVELDDHSLILAENTPAETFIDNADRLNFDNWAEHDALFPEGKPIVELALPRAKARRQVPLRIRTALDARAKSIGAEEAAAVA
ncbi:Hint domain-containing protein [Rhodoblastus sp. 17X3]|uniref:Hint domain-containing protein n=1 Tax=Rhodoblastus sp. 17X3 TaxID=3047026 RepID=UPI0024B68EB1|nr:Hint domain-containing protein [Rhodoblastus sp. 17X3]MDI9846938.1 Hint domain-containing protein [Rhodoblastus sp. 17X3]